MKKICLTIVVIALLLAGLLPDTALAASTSSTSDEAYSRILKLKEQGKIPAYVVEKGKYKYIEGTRVARVKGANVNMRSQPKIDSRRITRFNVNTELEYLGEWTHPKNGERWVCVRKNSSNEIGWIFGKYIEYASEASSVSTQNSGIRLISNADKEDKSYKKDKDCSEDPCGALGGFLLISPILYFIDKINKENKGSPTTPVVDYDKYSCTDTTDDYVPFWDRCCPGYKYRICGHCEELDRYNSPFSNVLYTKCKHFGKYVLADRSPQYNVENLESFEDECCPFYEKYSCGDCPWMDDTVPSSYFDGYYRCKHHNAYVQPDETPQYNSKNLKYS